MCWPFKKKLNQYEELLLRILGWTNFCDCGFQFPYEHTHRLAISALSLDTEKCACGNFLIFDHAVFGTRLDRKGYSEYRVFKCFMGKCASEKTIMRDLVFQEEISKMKEKHMTVEQNLESLVRNKIIIQGKLAENKYIPMDMDERIKEEVETLKLQKELNKITKQINDFLMSE